MQNAENPFAPVKNDFSKTRTQRPDGQKLEFAANNFIDDFNDRESDNIFKKDE